MIVSTRWVTASLAGFSLPWVAGRIVTIDLPEDLLALEFDRPKVMLAPGIVVGQRTSSKLRTACTAATMKSRCRAPGRPEVTKIRARAFTLRS